MKALKVETCTEEGFGISCALSPAFSRSYRYLLELAGLQMETSHQSALWLWLAGVVKLQPTV